MGGYLESSLNPTRQLTLDDWHNRYSQQAQWTRTVREYLFKKRDSKKQENILEVGSGTSAVLKALLEEGDYRLTGIDIDRASLNYSQNLNCDFQLIQANGEKLPFPSDNFSISFCHYLLLWVKEPIRILSEMKRVTKNKGWVFALAEPDYQGRIDYPPPLDQLGKQQTLALQKQGADTGIGRKLGSLFHRAGLVHVEIGILGSFWQVESDRNVNNLEWMTLQSDMQHLRSNDVLSAYLEHENLARGKGERVLFIPTFYAVGIVP